VRRTRFLDDFISGREDLLAIRDTQGVEAARNKAIKQLDALSKSRAERQKLTLDMQLAIQQKDAICRAALDNAYKSLAMSFFDLQFSRLDDKLDNLPAGAKEALAREKKITTAVTKGKTAFESGAVLKQLKESYAQAKENGQSLDQWLKNEDTRNKLLDLGTKVVPELSKNAKVGQGVSIAGGLIDAGYAATANYVYAGQIADELAQIEKLRAATIFSDVQANDWDRANLPLKAARERQSKLQQLGDYYEKARKENEDNAKKLRK
jgi:hypothetical protein